MVRHRTIEDPLNKLLYATYKSKKKRGVIQKLRLVVRMMSNEDSGSVDVIYTDSWNYVTSSEFKRNNTDTLKVDIDITDAPLDLATRSVFINTFRCTLISVSFVA